MDFETNFSYNLINVSVFKKGTYTYEVSNGESKFKLEILRLKEFVIINTRTSLSK